MDVSPGLTALLFVHLSPPNESPSFAMFRKEWNSSSVSTLFADESQLR